MAGGAGLDRLHHGVARPGAALSLALRRRLPLLTLLCLLYVPFLLQFGWRYRRIDNLDLPSFYAASVNVFRHHQSPYDFPRLVERMAGTRVQRVFPYLYPPPSLLFFAPLAPLSYRDARHAVLAVNHAALLLLLWLIPFRLLRADPGEAPAKRWLLAALGIGYLLAFHPVQVTLDHGQVNVVLLLFLVGFWLLARAGRASAAGLLLALAIALKTYPAVLVPLLALAGRRREARATLAWLAPIGALALAALPAVVWRDWLLTVLPTGGYGRTPVGLFSPANTWNQSLNGLFARLFSASSWSHPLVLDPALGRRLAYGAAALVTAASALCLWRARRAPAGERLDLALLVGLPLVYLIAPLSWDHHLTYLLPVILLLLARPLEEAVEGEPASPRRELGSLAGHALCVLAALVLALDVFIEVKMVAVLALWGLALGRCQQARALGPGLAPRAGQDAVHAGANGGIPGQAKLGSGTASVGLAAPIS